jgi:hypothetical protein
MIVPTASIISIHRIMYRIIDRVVNWVVVGIIWVAIPEIEPGIYRPIIMIITRI